MHVLIPACQLHRSDSSLAYLQVANAKVLAVGAGGIGCELLKTLVLSGFKNIEVVSVGMLKCSDQPRKHPPSTRLNKCSPRRQPLFSPLPPPPHTPQVDLDTIEVSNLNRQFLFRKSHVGQSKAAVAAAAVRRFRPAVELVPHQSNIKEPRYDLDFFRSFDMVLNGLDNLEARRHVNRMCVAAGVPLVESGTAGYLGQVAVHAAGRTECFDCQPKPTQKTYAVCTIRTRPEKPIHCVVWAKELLLPCLFGEKGEEGDIDPTGALQRGGGEAADAYAARVFQEVFATKIEMLLSDAAANPAEDVFCGNPPQALHLSALGPAMPGAEAAATPGSACAALGLTDQNVVWTPAQSAAVFLESVRRMVEHRPEDVGALVVSFHSHVCLQIGPFFALFFAPSSHVSTPLSPSWTV